MLCPTKNNCYNLTLYQQGLTIDYIAYVCTPNFIGVRIILDMCTLTRTLIFSLLFFKVFEIFLVLITLYCLKLNALYLTFNLFACPWKRQDSLLYIFVLKKPYFSFFLRNYLINISSYLIALANLRCQ